MYVPSSYSQVVTEWVHNRNGLHYQSHHSYSTTLHIQIHTQCDRHNSTQFSLVLTAHHLTAYIPTALAVRALAWPNPCNYPFITLSTTMSFNLDDFDPLASPKHTPQQPPQQQPAANTFHTHQLQQALPGKRSSQRTAPLLNGTIDAAASRLTQSNSRRTSPAHKQPPPESSSESDSDSTEYSTSSSSGSDTGSDTDNRQAKNGHTTKTTTTTTRERFTEYGADDKCSVSGCIQKRLPSTRTCPIHSTQPLKPLGGKRADQWTVQYTKSNTSLGMNKNICYWHIVDRGQEFDIELFHSTLGGKRVVKINGQAKINEKKVTDSGSRYNFMIGKDRRTSISVEIRPAGYIGHSYELFVNGRPYDEAKKFWLFNENA